MLKILMKPSRIDQQVSSIWTNLSLYCAISSQIKISRDSCRSSFDLREAAGAKKGEERKDIVNGLPLFPSFGTTCLLEHLHRHWESGYKPLLFFLGQPPSPLVAIWQVEAKINWRRTQASQRWVVWCSSSRGGPEWNRGEGGRHRDTGRQDTTQRRSFAYYWPANAQMALCRSPPHTIRDY